MSKEKLVSKKCDICGKVITSLWEKQLNYNMMIHMMTHEKEQERKKEESD